MKTINQAAKEYGEKRSSSSIFIENHIIDFKAGIEFTQIWINVNDELPLSKYGDELNIVLVNIGDQNKPITAWYDDFNSTWCMLGTGIELNVIEWRPIKFL